MPPKKQTIVIGLDFGTTHSGMAWAPIGSYITPVSGWPSRLTSSKDKQKVPSVLVYGPGPEPPLWGYQVTSDHVGLKWFKLLLLDEGDLPENVRHSDYLKMARLRLERSNRHTVEVIADYLRELWRFGLKDIQHAVGESRLSSTKLELVVTLPAIWPLYARLRMREAVDLAGILKFREAGPTGLSFISEPEAAALATVEDFAGRIDLKKNDHFVVCDAGGGTVDLITYKVSREKPFRVIESVKGDGSLCGAVCLDQGFFRLMKNKLPRKIWDQLGQAGLEHFMHTQWENNLKMNFHDQDAELGFQMPFGGTPGDGFHPPRMDFTRRELMDVFKPVVTEVAELVMKQIHEVVRTSKKAPKFVILVGGFGKSQVLHDTLEHTMGAQSVETEILQARGDRPWTAVCRGAVLRGFGRCSQSPFTMVDARVARASYGTTLNVLPWDAKDHDSRDKVWCDMHREFLAVDQTEWFIETGQHVKDPVRRFFWQDFTEPQAFIQTEIVYSTDEKPPKRCDDSVKQLCMIRWSRIPSFDELPIWTNAKGETFHQVRYEIRMVPDGASLDFEVFYEGVMVASRNVQVDCTDSGAKAQGQSGEERKADNSSDE